MKRLCLILFGLSLITMAKGQAAPSSDRGDPVQMVGMLIILVLVPAVYAIPSIVAFKRGHQNKNAILALNILLGWTFLGWVAALVWALTQATNTTA